MTKVHIKKQPIVSAPKFKGSTSMKPVSSGLWKDRPDLEVPTVFFTPTAREKVNLLVKTVTTEVGWWGTVERHGIHYLITDIFVPEQTVTGATTKIKATDLAALDAEILAAGRDPDELRYWGHSHVNFDVGPSSQDERQIQDYLQHVPWIIRGIHNKRGEQKIDVYDCENNTLHQCVKSQVVSALTPDEQQKLLDQINNRVKEDKPQKSFIGSRESFGIGKRRNGGFDYDEEMFVED